MTGLQLADHTIGFIGAGNMAEAIIKGILSSGIVSRERLIASDISQSRRRTITDTYGIRCVAENTRIMQEADILILAIKPQMAPEVLPEIAPRADGSKLLVSIVAGLKSETIRHHMGDEIRIIRTMPNTPVFVQEGMVVVGIRPSTRTADADMVQALFSPIARTIQTDEKLMDAVVGLSGSGPGYAFLMIDALAAGGVKMGLPRDVAVTLAAQTLLGAAKMCLETGKHPGRLTDMVTSPGGTTIAGLHAIESGAVRAALISAVEMATRRSEELGEV